VYTGNIHDPEGQATYCHVCSAVLIGRNGYELTAWNLSACSTCIKCGTRCPGVFEPVHGRWGSRRHPIRLGASAGVGRKY
jgi:pyruvate formate lyase activating enzyme